MAVIMKKMSLELTVTLKCHLDRKNWEKINNNPTQCAERILDKIRTHSTRYTQSEIA